MNNNFGTSDRIYRLVISLFQRFPEIEKAVIFGSRAIGNFKQVLDIDIALTGKNITSKLISKICAELNEELPVPYQLILLT
jgi:predicted nucleotidyltransferase